MRSGADRLIPDQRPRGVHALAFVALPALPLYCATKAAVPSNTQSLRFQAENAGAEVIEIRPGQANLLARMRRIAPGFIHRQFWKVSKRMVPAR